MPHESATPAAAGQRVFATQCDLIMKGGITSGIVYPLAVAEIAKAFELRCIGGTSAGAIAAAAAAAAELGRQRYRNGKLAEDPQGFRKLETLPAQLAGKPADGQGTLLKAFFKPVPTLRPLFDVFLSMLGDKSRGARVVSVVWALLRHFGFWIVLGALIGGAPLAWLAGRQLVFWPWVLAGALAGAVLVVIANIVRLLFRELPANRFGACSGMAAPDDPAPDEALTPWLTQYFDDLCGQAQRWREDNDAIQRAKPLTFGDLNEGDIDLQVMTTCLTLGRPFRMPFRDDDKVRENKQFYYRDADFEALFPPRITEWMKARERPASDEDRSDIDLTGFRRLPAPEDLPVVVAVRMSLSFPLLLSAIPLYSVDYLKPKAERRLERLWFTDGGVGSNFPIHFFDSALPSRPTFGLNLGQIDSEDARDPAHGRNQRVVFPATNDKARLHPWRRFPATGVAGVMGFLGAVVHVAKDWNHDTLSHLAGFRDRIGLIRLTKQEGGLNLTMEDALITKLTDYGREAGRVFVERFGDPVHWTTATEPSKMGWGNHQIIRLRLLLSSTAELLESLEKSCSRLDGTDAEYARFFDPETGKGSYAFHGLGELGTDEQGLYLTQAGLAQESLRRLRELSKLIMASNAARPATQLDVGAPKPTPELKLRPRI
ncbi:patatin-like phospholipase family protein [Pseudoxanthomonas indica]|uniref:Patatin-like phospholipase n=1 Tax=Pseudoxanthomonas indica TaxID=428993 RepID=A0A1T5LDE5_9GAMM|nr:patatin-like phospholipase family protein [Pseudoxanthomonas indica]GGD33921.1 RpoH suppressor [Pseudoxanthomonas indica]SKC73990.1 Patatin-like phospholipase [Pseudoxanthomonas indica]